MVNGVGPKDELDDIWRKIRGKGFGAGGTSCDSRGNRGFAVIYLDGKDHLSDSKVIKQEQKI